MENTKTDFLIEHFNIFLLSTISLYIFCHLEIRLFIKIGGAAKRKSDIDFLLN